MVLWVTRACPLIHIDHPGTLTLLPCPVLAYLWVLEQQFATPKREAFTGGPYGTVGTRREPPARVLDRILGSVQVADVSGHHPNEWWHLHIT